jgi:cytidyltransferase-like protein
MGKVLTRHELQARADEAHASGRSIAFANGCFDLLHVGHIRYLEAAAQEADVLVVAILPAAARAELVAALRFVDFVVIFPEATVGPLLQLLHPDVHCKGTDYTVESVPERKLVEAYGGRTAIVGDPKDHSTRDLLARISDPPSPEPRRTSPKR